MAFIGKLGNTLARLANFVLAHGQDEDGGIWPEPGRANHWTESNRMPAWSEQNRPVKWSTPTMTTLVKRASELRQYTMDMSNLPEISGGDTVSSVSSVTATLLGPPGSSALTLSSQAVASNNKGATVKISGGSDGATYLISFTVATAAGYTLVGIGYLYIDDR